MGIANVKSHGRKTKGKGRTTVKSHTRKKAETVKVASREALMHDHYRPRPQNSKNESVSYHTDERGVTVHFSKSFSKTFKSMDDIPEGIRNRLDT